MPDQYTNWESDLEIAARTDIGMRRSTNQDSHVVVTAADLDGWRERGHFFMVADGMGAHAAGELASKLTVDGVAHLYRKYTNLSPPESLEKALRETNTEVHRRGQANSDFRNMGTTASVLVLLPQGAVVAHIGDSRVYRIRGKVIEQLTFDHSLVWELRKAGQLSDDKEAAHSIPKNVITRSVGPNASVQVDIEGPFPLLPGDAFLLCSDGLTGKLDDYELAGIVAHLQPDEACQLLIDLANLRGGPDNITVIVTRVIGEGMRTESDEQPMAAGGVQDREFAESVMWVAVAVGLLVAVVLFITDRHWGAAAVAIASGILSIVALVVRSRQPLPGAMPTGERRRGRAPYTEAQRPSASEVADKLSDLTHDLRQRDPPSFPIDWSRFDQAVADGENQLRDRNFESAIRNYAAAIRALMEELRSAERQRASDSALDL